MGTRTLWAVVASILLLASLVRSGEHGLIRRLAQNDARAVEAWRALSSEERVARLRVGLRSNDKQIAYLSARVLDPRCLDLEELRHQATLLASRPEWFARDLKTRSPAWFDDHTPMPFGSPDLPKIWAAACSVADLPGATERLVYYHRALVPEQIPILVEHFDRAGPAVFLALAQQLRLVAGFSDVHRGAAARGFLYALDRLRCERAGKPRPRMKDTSADSLSKASFLRLAKASLGNLFDRDGFQVGRGPSLHPPRAWLVRWAREINLSADDIPFLGEVADLADEEIDEEFVAWAIRELGRLDARKELREIAADGDTRAVLAAAELARKGDSAPYRRFLRDKDWSVVLTMAWHALPVEARRRRLGEILIVPGYSDLEPWGRYEMAALYGARVRDEDIDWIGKNLLTVDAQPERVAAYFAQVHTGALTAELAGELARRLKAPEANGWISGPANHVEPDRWRVLGSLEAANRTAVVQLLDHWASRKAGGLTALALLGEARHVDAMLAAASDLDTDGALLGRVRDPRIEKHLRNRVEAGEDEAVVALAIQYGLPEPLRRWLDDPDDVERKLVLNRDPVGAVLHAARKDPGAARGWKLASLGHTTDKRAITFLRELRSRRNLKQYWAATGGLAIAGDKQAAQEFGTLMREGRIWVLDRLDGGQVLTMGRRKEWVEFWISRLNTNCCLSYIATSVLGEIYPTFRIEHAAIDYGRKDRFFQEWIAAHDFRYSRILNGLVPVAKAQ